MPATKAADDGQLYDNSAPRYLPHMKYPQVLHMGLAPMKRRGWIETDNHLAAYYRHKLLQRAHHGDGVYRACDESLPAQRELAQRLGHYLTHYQAGLYAMAAGGMYCRAGDYTVPVDDGGEPLWNSSLWIADDVVLMQQADGEYRLTAASLCSPSHWHLREKFGRPLREIHHAIPGFHRALTPKIDRFFSHLKHEYPVVRSNWALQADSGLYPEDMLERSEVTGDTPLFYRTERQSLLRLPQTAAVVFTIRVYLHPLESLLPIPGATAALFDAIDRMTPAIARYKGMDRLAPALASYRARLDRPVE